MAGILQEETLQTQSTGVACDGRGRDLSGTAEIKGYHRFGGPSEAARGMELFLPQHLQKEQTLLTPGTQTCGLHNCVRICFCFVLF